MHSKLHTLRNKPAPGSNVIMVAIFSSLLAVLCCADSNALNSKSKNQIHSSSFHAAKALDNSLFDESELFIPLLDTKHISNTRNYDKSYENPEASQFFQDRKKEKIHILSSAAASALLSSSTLSVDQLPEPQIQKQTPTGATSVSKTKNGKHHHKGQHHKHHSKKRHHKVFTI